MPVKSWLTFHLALGLAAISLFNPRTAAAQDLSEITRAIDGKRMRASSGLFDPESNRDSRPIAPGETLTLAELDGPGEIRHIWFTIGALDRRFTRSVVLRFYWDDSEVPSVEAPIGPLRHQSVTFSPPGTGCGRTSARFRSK